MLSQNRLVYDDIVINEESNRFQAMYLLENSSIFDNAKIIYSIVFDDEEYYSSIRNLNVLMIIVIIVGLVAIVLIFQIRIKEFLLEEKRKFARHAIHELKTPLSVISLNNQLRKKSLGNDTYTQEIESAIKILKNSYNDMSYMISDNKIEYKLEDINVGLFLKQRIDYFESIAKSQAREINSIINSNCIINISNIELTRLIDNNLINAIKYSKINSEIKVILEDNILSFESVGKGIANQSKIFESYERENQTRGGLGLGLSIVNDIANKYKIQIKLKYVDNKNIFIYKLSCKETYGEHFTS